MIYFQHKRKNTAFDCGVLYYLSVYAYLLGTLRKLHKPVAAAVCHTLSRKEREIHLGFLNADIAVSVHIAYSAYGSALAIERYRIVVQHTVYAAVSCSDTIYGASIYAAIDVAVADDYPARTAVRSSEAGGGNSAELQSCHDVLNIYINTALYRADTYAVRRGDHNIALAVLDINNAVSVRYAYTEAVSSRTQNRDIAAQNTDDL